MKIIRKIRNRTAPVLIKIGVLLNSPLLTAAAIWYGAEKINIGNKYTVLFIKRSIFIEDVKAMAEFSGEITYIGISIKMLEQISCHYIPKDRRQELTENNYYSGIFSEELRKGQEYIKRMFPFLIRIFNFDAVTSGNFGYISQQAFAGVCKEKGMPFIVLHKEGMNWYDKNMYKGRKFIGSKILLYNEKIRDFLLEQKIYGIGEKNSITVGIPRMDNYIRKEKEKTGNMVLFSFYPIDKFRYFPEYEKKKNEIEKVSENFHRTVIKYAVNNPLKKLVIKTKDAPYYIQYAKRFLQKEIGSEVLPDNINLTSKTKAVDLILKSDIVFGFKSTVLLEALISDRKLIMPDYSNIFPGIIDEMFDDYYELSSKIMSLNDIEKCLDVFKTDSPEYLQQKNECLNRYIYMPDGNASVRVEKIILDEIKAT